MATNAPRVHRTLWQQMLDDRTWAVRVVSGLNLSGTGAGLLALGLGLVLIGVAGWSLSRQL